MPTLSSRTKRLQAPPPPPSPEVLRFPRSRRTGSNKARTTADHLLRQNSPLLLMHLKNQSQSATPEKLFDCENDEPPTICGPAPSVFISESLTRERRERVEEDECGGYFSGTGAGRSEEEKWRFQAEILRAECKMLRMEREFALRKLEKNRVKMERTLKSAVQTLTSVRKMIFEGKNVTEVLDEEIQALAEKMEELQKNSGNKKVCEVQYCSNFDRTACLLQGRLENLKGLSNKDSRKDLGERAESSFCVDVNCEVDEKRKIYSSKTEDKSSYNVQMDMVRQKMEILSKGILNRVENEYDTILSIAANSSVTCSASTPKRIECPELSNISTKQLYQEPVMAHEKKCTGHCKSIVRRIVKQVRAETDQWAQMQEMLAQVHGEMAELQASRDFWENRAYNLHHEIRSLRHTVEEWKEKAIRYENKANELQLEITTLKEQIQNPNTDLSHPPLGKQFEKEKRHTSFRPMKNSHVNEKGCKYQNAPQEEHKPVERTIKKGLPAPLTLGKQLAREKRKIFRHHNCVHDDDGGGGGGRERGSKGEVLAGGQRKKLCSTVFRILDPPSRTALMDISSLSPLTRQISRSGFFGFRSPESSRITGQC